MANPPSGITRSSISPPGQEEPLHRLRPRIPGAMGGDLHGVSAALSHLMRKQMTVSQLLAAPRQPTHRCRATPFPRATLLQAVPCQAHPGHPPLCQPTAQPLPGLSKQSYPPQLSRDLAALEMLLR